MNNTAQSNTCDDSGAEARFSEALKVLGDFWTLRIISALADSPLRFCQLERNLVHSNPVTLSSRLKKLEEYNLVNRTLESEDKQSVQYSLTKKGYEVIPVVTAFREFSQRT
jgi:DNA-binding HxlR family transcriptional regulator